MKLKFTYLTASAIIAIVIARVLPLLGSVLTHLAFLAIIVALTVDVVNRKNPDAATRKLQVINASHLQFAVLVPLALFFNWSFLGPVIATLIAIAYAAHRIAQHRRP